LRLGHAAKPSCVIMLHCSLTHDKNDVLCQKIHCACYTSIYEPIFTSYFLPFTHNTSVTQTLGQATYSWWTIDAFCPTFSSLLYFSAFQLRWPSLPPSQPVSLTSMSAKPIRTHLAQRSHPAALGIADPRCHCSTLYRIHRSLHKPFHCHLEYPTRHFSLANHRCPKSFQLRYSRRFRLDDSWFSGFGGHLWFKFFPQGGPLRTKLVAKVIFLTI